MDGHPQWPPSRCVRKSVRPACSHPRACQLQLLQLDGRVGQQRQQPVPSASAGTACTCRCQRPSRASICRPSARPAVLIASRSPASVGCWRWACCWRSRARSSGASARTAPAAAAVQPASVCAASAGAPATTTTDPPPAAPPPSPTASAGRAVAGAASAAAGAPIPTQAQRSGCHCPAPLTRRRPSASRQLQALRLHRMLPVLKPLWIVGQCPGIGIQLHLQLPRLVVQAAHLPGQLRNSLQRASHLALQRWQWRRRRWQRKYAPCLHHRVHHRGDLRKACAELPCHVLLQRFALASPTRDLQLQPQRGQQ